METTIKTINASAKATNQVFSNAKKDVKNISPFYFINQLNKFAKRNEFCENVNVKNAQKEIEKIFGCKGFDANILHKTSFGKFANIVNIPKTSDARKIDVTTFEGLVIITTIDAKGIEHKKEYEIINETQMLVPISANVISYLSAFQKRAKEYYKGQKDTIRANKQKK